MAKDWTHAAVNLTRGLDACEDELGALGGSVPGWPTGRVARGWEGVERGRGRVWDGLRAKGTVKEDMMGRWNLTERVMAMHVVCRRIRASHRSVAQRPPRAFRSCCTTVTDMTGAPTHIILLQARPSSQPASPGTSIILHP